MLPRLFGLLLLPTLLFRCGNAENEALRKQVDSLNVALTESQRASQTLAEVAILMDSIDASRNLLRLDMVEGTPYENFTGRMKDLNEYIKKTEQRIADLENSLKKAKTDTRGLMATIRKLRVDLEKKTHEVAMLQEQVEKYRNENEALINLVDLQEAEIADKQEIIEAKNQELALIEARVQELLIQSKISDADAYYMRAQAIEEAAKRTRLAPRKKRETLKEAIELYKKALSLGKNEAREKIAELEGKL